MKVEVFATIDELKADRVERKVSDKEIIAQKKFIKAFKKVRKRNLKSQSTP